MSLARYEGVALGISGSDIVVSPSALVTVRREDTGALASLKSDRDGLDGIANPITADAYGRFGFHCVATEDGLRITVTEAASPGLEYTLRYQQCGTMGELDANDLWRSLLALETADDVFEALVADLTQAQLLDVLGAGAAGGSLFTSDTVLEAQDVLKLENAALEVTIGNGNATFTMKARDTAGSPLSNDISPANPVTLVLRSATATDGIPNRLEITSPLTHVVQQGSLYGTTSTVPFRLWAAVFLDTGNVPRLAVSNRVATAAHPTAPGVRDVTALHEIGAWGIGSTVVEAGSPSGEADAAGEWYADVAMTDKPFAVLGYAEWGEVAGSPSDAGLVVAGTYARLPTRQQTWSPGVPLPGQKTGNLVRVDTGELATGSNPTVEDDTPPLQSEGDQFMEKTITPKSAANVLVVDAVGFHSNSVAGASGSMASLHRDSISPAIAASRQVQTSTLHVMAHRLQRTVLAWQTLPTAFKYRAGNAAAGTTTFNGHSGARQLGGAMNSFIQIEERMG